MIPVIPSWFLVAVKQYDRALRLRWSDDSKQFCLERKISNTPSEALDKLRKVLQETANRALTKPVPPELYVPQHVWAEQVHKYEDAVAYRIICCDKLAALNAGHHWIFHVPPPLNEFTLECVLFTLKATDVWRQGGADKMTNDRDYEEVLAERRQERSRESDSRHMALDAFRTTQRKLGERIIRP